MIKFMQKNKRWINKRVNAVNFKKSYNKTLII